jgi:formate dehydrogenase major subunit
VIVPGATLPEKEGTFTNLQGRVQRIHQAFPPKGQAVSDLEAFRRIGARIFPGDPAFRSADALDVFEEIRASMPQMMQSEAVAGEVTV